MKLHDSECFSSGMFAHAALFLLRYERKVLAYQINVSDPYITSLHFTISRSITSHYKGEHYETEN